jgi:serine protease Do
VIVEFDGERIRSTRQFTRLVQETVPGRSVPAAVMRAGQRVSITVQPSESGSARYFGDLDGFKALRVPPAPPAPPAAPKPPAEAFEWFSRSEIFGGSGRLGITVSELSSQLAGYFGTKDGVLVTSVTDDSSAGKAGLRAGDVITSLNGGAVNSTADLRRRLQRLESGDELTLEIVRDKKPMTLKGKIEERQIRRSTRTIL